MAHFGKEFVIGLVGGIGRILVACSFSAFLRLEKALRKIPSLEFSKMVRRNIEIQ